MRNQKKQQNDSDMQKLKKPTHKDLPSIEILIPGCTRVDDSEAAVNMISSSIELLIEAAHRGWCAAEDTSGLSTELAKWLVEVCDPKRECKMCKIGKGLGPGIKDERTMA